MHHVEFITYILSRTIFQHFDGRRQTIILFIKKVFIALLFFKPLKMLINNTLCITLYNQRLLKCEYFGLAITHTVHIEPCKSLCMVVCNIVKFNAQVTTQDACQMNLLS